MSRKLICSRFVIPASLIFVGIVVAAIVNRNSIGTEPEQGKARQAADNPKRLIELPLEEAIAGKDVAPALADVGKYRIESSVKTTIEMTKTIQDIVSIDGLVMVENKDVAPEKKLDVGKGAIEGPIELLLVLQDPAPRGLDDRMNLDESMMDMGEMAGMGQEAAPTKPIETKVDEQGDNLNPKVKPGKVSWHESFDAACVASEQSGKPVLLFQLLGQLDQRFT